VTINIPSTPASIPTRRVDIQQIVNAEGYAAAAEAARDSSFANARGAATIADARALVADNDTFIVYAAGAETFEAYRRLTSSTQTLLGTYPAALLVRERLTVDPFPAEDWETPITLNLLANPAASVTYGQQTFEVANGGRFYAVPTIASLGLAIGDTVRVAFRRVSGTGQPSAITFRAGTTLVSTVDFVQRGGWWIAEAAIPDTTTIIRIDWTNGTGGAATITRPAFAKRATGFQRLGRAERRALASLAADPGGLGNLWPSSVTVSKIAGGGEIGDVTIGSGGAVTLPADIQIRVNGLGISRPVGAVMTILARASAPLSGLSVRFVGATSGTQVEAMRPVGDGWWLLRGHTIAIGGSSTINEVRLEPDNRNGTGSLFVSGPVTIDRIIVLDGSLIPSRLPAAAPDTYPDAEIVVTQASGQINVHHRAGPTRYARWQVDRYDVSADRALGWRIRGLASVLRSGDTSFSDAVALAYTGEHETAIQEEGKSDFMGGSTHGDQEETRALPALIDGTPITPDGATSYRARQVELIQRSELLEVDNVTRTVTATLTTRWLWRDNELILDQRLEWARSINVLACYLGMWALLRGGVTDTARVSPVYDAVDVSSTPHASPQGNFQRLTQSGPLGGFDMEAIKGWSSNARALVQDAVAGNKLYFAPIRFSPATAVTAGSVIEFATRYRVGLT
jgi:hypothetical protein